MAEAEAEAAGEAVLSECGRPRRDERPGTSRRWPPAAERGGRLAAGLSCCWAGVGTELNKNRQREMKMQDVSLSLFGG